ncbi:c-type cytochrome [Aestuariibius insulae]|uniref:c-type cytochrome n=1 Tax=Aestuariibius insulae TaxID=2058287 RepID=UPI00345EEB36
MKHLAIAAAAALLTAPVHAEGHIDLSGLQGDAAAGEEQFNRQCVACHVVVDEEGETIAGRNARTGPNQYGLAYELVGNEEDFRYSDGLIAIGETGQRWTEDAFVAYVQDPTGWIRETLDDRRARGKMSYKVRDEQEAYDLFAYLASVGPVLEGEKLEAFEADTAEGS